MAFIQISVTEVFHNLLFTRFTNVKKCNQTFLETLHLYSNF